MKSNSRNYCSAKAVLILCAALVVFSNKASCQTAMFGTNPQHTGVYDASMPTELILVKKWKFKTDGMIFSSAVVVNNVIYIGSDDSCLYAVNADGTLKWKFKSNGIIRSTPAVKDTVAYFNNYGGKFYAIGTKTGNKLWHFDTEGESPRTGKGLNWCTPKDMEMTDPWDFYLSSPIIVDTIAYFGSGANVYAIGLKSKKQLWKYTAPNIVHSSPAFYNDKLYFGCWDSKFYALNAITGKEIWSFQTGLDAENHGMEGIQSSPSIIDTIVVFGSRDANVYALGANAGKKIWSTNFGGTWMPSSYAYYNETLFTGSSEGVGLKALNLADGKIKNTTSTNFYYTFSTPAIANETAFIGCMNGSLFAVDANNGKIKCRFDTDGRISDPLNAILDDGTLNPSVFNPVSGSEYTQAVEYMRRVHTAGSIASTPSIDANVIYFGSTDSCIYAVYDTATCKPEIQVTTNTLDIGQYSNAVSIDTSFYVSNISECIDSLKVYAAGNTSSALKEAIEIEPSGFTLAAGDSVKIHIEINPADLEGKSYKLNIVSQSKTNEYKSANTEIAFKIDAESGMQELGKGQSAVIYPNPFNDFINVKTDCGNSINILNTIGAIMLQQELKQTDSQIDLSFLQSGVFVVVINSNDKVYTTKIVKH